MTISQDIHVKLNHTFKPTFLEVKDQSHLHKGHAGYNPKGESHFHIVLISEVFKGKSRIQRHQLVYDCLKEELKNGVHALSMELFAPGEEGALYLQG